MATGTSSFDIRSKEWTPEQQQQEFIRRMDILGFAKEAKPPFTPLPNDVICVIPYKSGTTWITHICHQLRMHGAEPDFEDQTKIVCWIETNVMLHGVPPDEVKQPGDIRIFVTHYTEYDIVPKAE